MKWMKSCRRMRGRRSWNCGRRGTMLWCASVRCVFGIRGNGLSLLVTTIKSQVFSGMENVKLTVVGFLCTSFPIFFLLWVLCRSCPFLLEVTLLTFKGNDLAIACLCTRLRIAVFLCCLFARSVKVCIMIIFVELCEFILKVLCWPWFMAEVTQNTGKISFIFSLF